jgi:hypothetical protein
MPDPFDTLGLDPRIATEKIVLRAWRRLACEDHPDKGGDGTRMQSLNEAKEACLEHVAQQENPVLTEYEYATHICKILDRKMWRDGITGICLEEGGQNIVRLRLREFYDRRAVDAMEWILHCAIGDAPFDQAIEDEIPILCKFYNEFIGEGRWSEDDHTVLTVLNKYDDIRAGGYGNFAQFVEE